MAQLISWAAAKVAATGVFIGGSADRVLSVVATGVGVYEITLENALGVPECCPTVTPWYTPSSASAPMTWGNAGLKIDGITLVVNIFSDVAGVTTPTDGAFCLVVDRFMP
jgi:hypothetical protein